jgi:putative glutamine amidotransferase
MTVRIGVSYVGKRPGPYYLAAIREAGAEPVSLLDDDNLPRWPTAEQAKAIFDPRNPAVVALDDLDGLLLTGGGDVDPMLYREPMNGSELPSWPRDHLETAQYHRARVRGLPIFGICRGLQVLNVAMGGSLVQDLASADAHRDPNWKKSRSHLARVVGGTALARFSAALDPWRISSSASTATIIRV